MLCSCLEERSDIYPCMKKTLIFSALAKHYIRNMNQKFWGSKECFTAIGWLKTWPCSKYTKCKWKSPVSPYSSLLLLTLAYQPNQLTCINSPSACFIKAGSLMLSWLLTIHLISVHFSHSIFHSPCLTHASSVLISWTSHPSLWKLKVKINKFIYDKRLVFLYSLN